MLQASQNRRIAAARWLCLSFLALLMARLISLQFIQADELTRKAARLTDTRRTLEAWRGAILDSSGEPLALPTAMVNVYADLKLISNYLDRVIPQWSPLLRISDASLNNYLRTNLGPRVSARGTNYLKALVVRQKMMLAEWSDLTNSLARATFGFDTNRLTRSERYTLYRLRTQGLYPEVIQTRAYPQGTALAHVIGIAAPVTNLPARLQGRSGLEQYFENELAGKPGVCVSAQDAAGNELPFRRIYYQPPEHGNNLVLTIDLKLQQIAERALVDVVRKHQPSNASVLILRTNGEILAWASWPAFWPQNPRPTEPNAWRNTPISDAIEPGSTFKPFVLAAAINEDAAGLDDGVDCEHGQAWVGGVRVRDHGRHDWLTLRRAFAKSSNIAMAKLAVLLGEDRLRQYYLNFGFGRITSAQLWGEVPGYLPVFTNAMMLTRASFGQGISVSQLQMALGYCAIANGGELMVPLLVKRVETPDGRLVREWRPRVVRRVISEETARQVREAMAGVVSREGTAFQAALEDYTVGGKTGTAQKSDRRGYLPDRYYASFIGVLPAEQPEICIAVGVDEPHNGYYGGQVAAPVFRAIAAQAAAHLGIPPNRFPHGRPSGRPALAPAEIAASRY